MNTPIHPPIALPIVWDTSYLCVLMNSMEHAGIRHAQEPMNTGKQAVPSTPSRRQVAIHGAYRPKPISIRAPHKILSPAATINFHPVKPVAVPTAPKGPTPVFLQSIIIARGIMMKPRAYLILLRGHFVTMVANPNEPTAAHMYIIHKNIGSQSTDAVKMNASKITGKVSINVIHLVE